MTHEARIVYDARYLSRPWGVRCSCGHHTANDSELDAKESLRRHLPTHTHRCVECKMEFPCDCPYPENLTFPDCFGLCPTCREK